MKKFFWALCSLKLAVVVILSLAISLGAGTILESLYDTPTAQYWIYRAVWFHLILGLLGVNIFCVAVSRYPWRKRHIPFLLAHLGILMLLFGSWMTEQIGVDGNVRVSEGETASVVELDNASLVLSEQDKVNSIPIPWTPSSVQFRPFDVASYGMPYDLKVDQFLSHADPIISFVPEPPSQTDAESSLNKKSASAIQVRMAGGPMGISEDIWLWEGASGWKTVQAGPAKLSLGEEGTTQLGRPSLNFKAQKDGSIDYVAHSSEGKKVHGNLRKGHIQGEVIHPGWRGNVTVTVTEWVPRAVALTTYKPARIQFGAQAPTSAIHVVAGQSTGPSTDVWLGLGDRAVLHMNDREVEIGYFPKRFVLPFSLRLARFTVEHDQGTLNPASYASQVLVLDGKSQKEVTISMNEPLEMGGYTIYQASYEDADPRPVTSIFAVNRDPGRLWKYFGSLLIVLGSILLFAAKYRKKRVVPATVTV